MGARSGKPGSIESIMAGGQPSDSAQRPFLRATGRRAAGLDFDFADDPRLAAGRAFAFTAEDFRDNGPLLRSPSDEDSAGFDDDSLVLLSAAGVASALASV